MCTGVFAIRSRRDTPAGNEPVGKLSVQANGAAESIPADLSLAHVRTMPSKAGRQP
jgi:hypothetical protein